MSVCIEESRVEEREGEASVYRDMSGEREKRVSGCV